MGSLKDRINNGRQEGLKSKPTAGGYGCPGSAGKKSGRSDAASDTGKGQERPTIQVTTNEHLVNDQAVTVLASQPDIYQRLGQLVRIVVDAGKDADGGSRSVAPRIESLPIPVLRDSLSRSAQWERPLETKGAEGFKAVHVPEWCVAYVHAVGSWPGVRPLEAVISYPVLKPDGTVLSKPGYDADTGLLLAAKKLPAAVPDNPTRVDAISAKEALLEVVSDFPFQSDAYRAAWLAALLTPIARFAFSGPAPLFLVEANIPGAGKGLLLNIISCIHTGGPFTIAAYTQDPEELRKRITSLALSGDREVLFDNLEGRFGNHILDAALTASTWKDRLLNSNKVVDIPLNVSWYATGNNVELAGDMARRICHILLESSQERPEERKDFRRPKLLAWVRQHRGQLARAALTILRAYFVAGRPNMGLAPWGSFEGWSDLVRAAVVWVGLPDPGLTRQELRERADTDSQNVVVLMDAMQHLDPDGHGLAADDIIALYDTPTFDFPQDQHKELRDAFNALLPKRDNRTLGALLKRYKNRPIGGRRIILARTVRRAARWTVARLGN